MGLSRAMIEVLDREAVDKSRGLPGTFEVQFNPGSYEVTAEPSYGATSLPGLMMPLLNFARGEAERLEMELVFDVSLTDSEEKDVRDLTKPFVQLAMVQPKIHAPPRFRFTWGQGLSFKAVIERLVQRFTSFNESGVPIQSYIDVTFRQFLTLKEQLQALNLQSSDHTKVVEVRSGDTLPGIAQREYGDPRAWRTIADANAVQLTNPRHLEPGSLLLLPPSQEVYGDKNELTG